MKRISTFGRSLTLVLVATASLASAQSASELDEDDPADMPEIAPEQDSDTPLDPSEGEIVTPPVEDVDRNVDPLEPDDVPPPVDNTPEGTPAPSGAEAPLPVMPELTDDVQLVLPGQARNETRGERSAHGVLWIPRIIFAPLRFAFWITTLPLVTISRLNDRYHFIERFFSLFVSEDGTYGVVPNAFVETGFGLNAGIRAFHRDLFGKGESIRAHAGFGGFFTQQYDLAISSGDRSSHVTVEAGVQYAVRQNDRFFGIGNADLADPYDVDLPQRLYDPEHSVLARYRRRTLLGELALSFPLSEGIRLRAAHRWEWTRFETADRSASTPWIDQAYPLEQLVGFTAPQTHAVTELRLLIDRRRQESVHMPPTLPSHGALLQTWVNWQHGIREDPSRFARLGFDFSGFINLFMNDRILRIRSRFEAIAGRKENVPFDGWAILSGPNVLRGYSRQRFRSRYAGLVSAEYRYTIADNMTAFAFVDVGLIFNRPEQLHPRDWRPGYGGGLMFHTKKSFLIGMQIAASPEGLFFNLSLSPVDATSGSQ